MNFCIKICKIVFDDLVEINLKRENNFLYCIPDENLLDGSYLRSYGNSNTSSTLSFAIDEFDST